MNDYDRYWEESNPELVELIRDEIRTSGPIRFDRFMELALYHPEHGYYRSRAPAPGRLGDFITAPEAHPIFGATLATQISDFDRALGHPDDFRVIEYGAGSGRLIRPLLAEIRQQNRDLYERIGYVPVELNDSRLAELHAHLADGEHAHLIQAAPPKDGATGCLIANEFLDAFPVRRVTRRNGSLRESRVGWKDGWFAEILDVPDDSDIEVYLTRHGFHIEEDEWVEIHPGFRDWAAEIGRTLASGFALIIDYGYPAEELFQEHRRQGTMRTYFQHGTSVEYFRAIGRQDLTAHVNFSEVIYQAERNGLVCAGLTTQSELLEALGLGDRLVRLQENPALSADEYLSARAAVMRMIDPGAMGRFRALFLATPDLSSERPLGLEGSRS